MSETTARDAPCQLARDKREDWLVSLVYLVSLVRLVEPDRPDRPDEQRDPRVALFPPVSRVSLVNGRSP
jgi:hypothetical protein